MGIISAEIELSNPRRPDLKAIRVNALADTGSVHLVLPEHIVLQLQLEEAQKKEVTTADGKKHLCPYVGPLKVEFFGRVSFTGAIVLGDQVLLGAIPMEDMDIVLAPKLNSVQANPDSPNFPSSIAK